MLGVDAKAIRTRAAWAAGALAVGLVAAALVPAMAAREEERGTYDEVASRLSDKGLRELGAYATLKKLLSVGPRLTGSPQADEAASVMAAHMREIGFDQVRQEPVTVGRWVRGEVEEGRIISAAGTAPVKVRALGNSVATPPEGITAEVVEVRSFEELQAVGDRARGRVVFFNGPMDPTRLDTFQAYGGAVRQRSGGAVAAAKAGAVAAVVRSLTLSINDDPHTGTMSYDEATPKIPAVTISTAAAERLSGLLQKEPRAKFFLRTSSRTLPPVVSHNVMGEIRGASKPEEIVLVGGHLDSWDLSAGAHDDGAGCAQAIEALRLIEELGLKPARTIRAVLFMDEENGGTGGRAYAASERRAGERHVAAIESDRGGFLPLGIGAGPAEGPAFPRLKALEPLFQRIGLQWIRPGGGGVDIAPLGASGAVLMGLVPDSQRYFDVHHSGIDTIETVNPRELQLGANSLALLAYVLAQEGAGR